LSRPLKGFCQPPDPGGVRKPYTVLLTFLAVACAAPIAAASSGDDPPTVETQAPANVTPAAAQLQGALDDNGGHTDTYWFELGTSTTYGTTTAQKTTKKSHLDVQQAVGGLAKATTYHFRLAASNEHGTSYGADMTFTTQGVPAASPIPMPDVPVDMPGDDDAGDDATALPPAAAPELGHSVGVAAGSGTVLVRVPGSSRAIALTDASSVPVGAVLDTRRGSVDLTTELPGGKTQTGTFHGGLFQVRQPAGTGGMTELVLRGPMPTCGAGGARAAATSAKRPPRGLWGRDDHGRFRTRASNSVATVRGTEWYVADRCDGTLTRVRRGSVSVRDVHSGRTVVVRAGHSYLARRP
jgi:hypothetical protein